MAKRTIGAERLFSLGDYKNVRLIESMEFDDDGLTEQDLDALRLTNIHNLYLGFALHQAVLQEVKEAGFDSEEITQIIKAQRNNLEEIINDMWEEKDE